MAGPMGCREAFVSLCQAAVLHWEKQGISQAGLYKANGRQLPPRILHLAGIEATTEAWTNSAFAKQCRGGS